MLCKKQIIFATMDKNVTSNNRVAGMGYRVSGGKNETRKKERNNPVGFYGVGTFSGTALSKKSEDRNQGGTP
jgi:hypothetical protein